MTNTHTESISDEQDQASTSTEAQAEGRSSGDYIAMGLADAQREGFCPPPMPEIGEHPDPDQLTEAIHERAASMEETAALVEGWAAGVPLQTLFDLEEDGLHLDASQYRCTAFVSGWAECFFDDLDTRIVRILPIPNGPRDGGDRWLFFVESRKVPVAVTIGKSGKGWAHSAEPYTNVDIMVPVDLQFHPLTLVVALLFEDDETVISWGARELSLGEDA